MHTQQEAQQESIKKSRAAMRKFEAEVGITPGMSKAEKRAQRAKLQAQRSLDSRDAKMMSRGEWAEMSPDRRSSMCKTRRSLSARMGFEQRGGRGSFHPCVE